MKTHIKKRDIAAMALLTLSALAAPAQCPDGHWLEKPLPEEWRNDTIPVMTAPAEDSWWSTFHDGTLTQLINTAEKNNYDLAAAMKRIDAARLTLQRAKAGYFPTIGLGVSWTMSRQSGLTGKTQTQAVSSTYFDLGLTAQWEIDVFGRISSQIKADKASLQASRADRAAMGVSIGASVAKTYITLRTYQQQLEVALDHIDSQEKILAITQARFESGLASALDVVQARNVVLSTKATIPGLRFSIENNINALATLCGVYPPELPAEVKVTSPLPDPGSPAPIGVPADLLRRRPDIISSEYQLRALAARLNVAKKEFLPTLSIAGQIGTTAHEIGDLFKNGSFTYSVTPQLSWTVFDGLARNRDVQIARADLEAAVETYNQTVMSAVEEVNDNLSHYTYSVEEIGLYREVYEESGRQLELAMDRYKLGLSDFSNVADAQMSQLEYRNALISAQSNALLCLVSIYQSLGGGWACDE